MVGLVIVLGMLWLGLGAFSSYILYGPYCSTSRFVFVLVFWPIAFILRAFKFIFLFIKLVYVGFIEEVKDLFKE